MTMKTYVLAAAALAIVSGSATAAPLKHKPVYKPGYQVSKLHKPAYKAPKITPAERLAIARSQANLNALKRRIYADGRVSTFERVQLKLANARHDRLVANARRS